MTNLVISLIMVVSSNFIGNTIEAIPESKVLVKTTPVYSTPITNYALMVEFDGNKKGVLLENIVWSGKAKVSNLGTIIKVNTKALMTNTVFEIDQDSVIFGTQKSIVEPKRGR